mgnify:CR=1 FL=1
MSEQTTKWRWVRLFCAVLLTPFAHALAYPQGATSYTAAAVYFLQVFGTGFALAFIRIPVLVPRFGVRTAELMEVNKALAVAKRKADEELKKSEQTVAAQETVIDQSKDEILKKNELLKKQLG